MASFFVVPPFHELRNRYDLHTFKGRAWHFYRACNPQLMFETDQSIKIHQDRIAEFASMRQKTGGSGRDSIPYSDADLWYAKSVVDGCVHPTTKQTIFAPFRFASYAPINLALVPLMLAPSTIASKGRSIAAHAANQTVNALANYANRSSEDVGIEKLAVAYIAAIVSSCSFAMGASAVMSKIKDTGSFKATAVRATLPFMACVSASLANLCLMRVDEWSGRGVPVRAAAGPLGTPENDDNAGNIVGYSLLAGREGVMYCAYSRLILNIAVMTAPALIMGIVGRHAFIKKHPKSVGKPLDFLVTGGMTLFAVPLCLALMKPVVTTPVSGLEEQFQSLSDSKGRPIEYVTFYKGL